MVNNSFYDPPSWNPALWAFKRLSPGGISNADALPVSTRSLFEVLQSAGYSWKVFWQDEWPPKDTTAGAEWQYTRTMLPLLLDAQFDANFVKFDANDLMSPFYEAARQGALPAVSWIEPKWGGGAMWDTVKRAVGNDYHPVSDTTVGEDFVMNVYNALSAAPTWPNTLLIITFDENGGTYDHVYPPAALPPGNESCPLPHAPIPRHDLYDVVHTPVPPAPPLPPGPVAPDPTIRTQFGFDFAQYGVRVPTLLISPRVPPRTIFRSTNPQVPFDHTSIIATILTLAQVDPTRWQLGERVANAPTFEHLFMPAATNLPAAPLSIPDGRSAGATVTFNQPYLLEYVGDPWHADPGAVYLGPSATGKIPSYYYPTLTSEIDKAIPFLFAATGGGEEAAPIANMSVLRIATTEPSYTGLVLLTAAHENSAIFYGRDAGTPGAKWQIRILSSRDRGDSVRVGDLVYFVSQLGPAVYQGVSQRITPDPMQRLLPHPKDPTYATTRAGEWALWKIVAVPSS
jgi:hypothetical protein